MARSSARHDAVMLDRTSLDRATAAHRQQIQTHLRLTAPGCVPVEVRRGPHERSHHQGGRRTRRRLAFAGWRLRAKMGNELPRTCQAPGTIQELTTTGFEDWRLKVLFAFGLSGLAVLVSYRGVAKTRHWASGAGCWTSQCTELAQPRHPARRWHRHRRGHPCRGPAVPIVVPDGSWRDWLSLTVGALLVAVVSWRDDVRTLPNWIRFTTHLAAAAIAVIGIGAWRHLHLPLLGPWISVGVRCR